MGFLSKLLGRKEIKDQDRCETANCEDLQEAATLADESSLQASISSEEAQDNFFDASEEVSMEGDGEFKGTVNIPEADIDLESNAFLDPAEPVDFSSAPDQNDLEADLANKAALGQEEFILKLREANPTPGGWLQVVLEGVDEVDESFWQRLEILLFSLNTPAEKAEIFLSDLRSWLNNMGLSRIADISSELQYRLAITLGMEDDVEEKQRFWTKLWQGLARTREFFSGSLRGLFTGSGELDNSFWESLEEALIISDVGYEASLNLVERIKSAAKKQGTKTRTEAKALLQSELEAVFTFPPRIEAVNPPEIVLMVGVNGAGKTTTIAKLAYRERLRGRKVLVAAGDTFRAAAVEQLEVWAKRVGAGFYAKDQGADPAAVAYEAVGEAVAGNYDVVFIDTAGRLQTKAGLMEELGKIGRVLAKRHPGAPHRCILVLDATTGQNALSQTKLFSESAPVSEIIISKLDGTAKAGVAVGVAMQHKIPITYIGLGEKMEDLRPFEGAAFAKALLE